VNFNLEILERLFKTKAPALIGCDISSSSVKLVEIADAGKNVYRVERYSIEPLPRDAVVDGNINNLEAVSDCLKRGWKRMGTNIKGLALALPSAAVITKKIVVPAGQMENELELQVETEANQYIPFALDEVNLDFQVIGPAPNSPDDVEVLIAMFRFVSNVDAAPYLPKIAAPVLALYPAAAGVITKDEHTQLLREKVRNLRMVRVPLEAHSLQIVAPATCAQEVLYFIAQHDGIVCREA